RRRRRLFRGQQPGQRWLHAADECAETETADLEPAAAIHRPRTGGERAGTCHDTVSLDPEPGRRVRAVDLTNLRGSMSRVFRAGQGSRAVSTSSRASSARAIHPAVRLRKSGRCGCERCMAVSRTLLRALAPPRAVLQQARDERRPTGLVAGAEAAPG